MPPFEGKVTAGRICQYYGITYRQLDSWVRCGWVGGLSDQERCPGSGHPHRWDRFTEEQWEQIRLLSVASRLLYPNRQSRGPRGPISVRDLAEKLRTGELVIKERVKA